MSGRSFSSAFDFRLAILGFLVALFSAGIGIGGGTLLVSILMAAFGFEFKKAASTSLATIIPISFVGAVNHVALLPAAPSLRLYLLFIPACVLGTLLGGNIVREHRTGWLKLAFALFLLVVSLRMLKIFDVPLLLYSGIHTLLLTHESLLIIPVGILIGMIAVLLGIGCGLLIVPFYVIVIKLDMHQAITLSLTTMFFLSVSATLIHNKLNTFDKTPMKSLFGPALAGAVAGAIISSHLPAFILKQLFGGFLFLISCNFIIQELKSYRSKAKTPQSL
ncbi:hypothetical protein SAMN05216233_106150 [Desulfoluna spongiiphila]|uniref:Probable membrane transporter protein n=2 Tax=Desulfoluna spongiiphila TaxID=419481 RepID=A0A1G5EQ47_9BACT|nr:hypothetical protein SAMN05216233_106150 [Desulfoluna spongiiphila]